MTNSKETAVTAGGERRLRGGVVVFVFNGDVVEVECDVRRKVVDDRIWHRR